MLILTSTIRHPAILFLYDAKISSVICKLSNFTNDAQHNHKHYVFWIIRFRILTITIELHLKRTKYLKPSHKLKTDNKNETPWCFAKTRHTFAWPNHATMGPHPHLPLRLTPSAIRSERIKQRASSPEDDDHRQVTPDLGLGTRVAAFGPNWAKPRPSADG